MKIMESIIINENSTISTLVKISSKSTPMPKYDNYDKCRNCSNFVGIERSNFISYFIALLSSKSSSVFVFLFSSFFALFSYFSKVFLCIAPFSQSEKETIN